MYHLLSVRTDEEGSVRLRANPFAIGCIDGDASDGDIVKQVISQAAAVVAVNLNLGEVEILVKHLCDIFDDEEAGRRADPYQAVQVFA